MGMLQYVQIIDLSGLKRRYLFRWGHINYVPGPHKPLWDRHNKAYMRVVTLNVGVRRQNEHIVSVMKHLYGEDIREALGRGV